MSAATSSKKSEELRSLMIEVARTQVAAVTAAVKFWDGWVKSADQYTQAISAELAKVDEGSEGSKEFVGRLTDLSRQYLRDLSDLPNLAVKQFTSEVEKIGKPTAKRARAARAKD
jgi:hypothetical protein